MTAPIFPGGTSLTALDVYEDAAPDGLHGGSPHMHLVSTECYIVTGGTGWLHTIDGTGVHETRLEPGVVAWFSPGTVHRVVGDDRLRVMVLMSNAGLPEAGDAVMTFPPDILADPRAYAAAARLPDGGSESERAQAAARRRDLAVAGYATLRSRTDAGDTGALAEFHAAATALVAVRTATWSDIVDAGPAHDLQQTRERLQAVAASQSAHLAHAELRVLQPAEPVVFGMCGRLHPYPTIDTPGRTS